MKVVGADDMREAAMVFAGRLARKSFGRRADVRVLRQDCTSFDYRMAEYEAFIGLTSGNETTGRNVRFTVWID